MTDDESAPVTLAQQGSITLFGSVFRRLVLFAFLVVITRLVSSDVFGVFTLATAIVLFLQQIFSLSTDRAVDYFVPASLSEGQVAEARGVLVKAAVVGIAGSVVGAVLLIANADAVSGIFNEPRLVHVLPLLALFLPAQTLMKLLSSHFAALKNLHYRAYVESFTFPVVKFLTTVLFVLLGADLLGLAAGHLLGVIVAIGVGSGIVVVRTRWVISREFSRKSSRMLSYSLPLAFAGVIVATVGQVDFFIIGYFIPDSSSLAYYKVSYQFAGNLLIVLSSLTPVFKPMISESKESKGEVQNRYQLATRWTILLTLPIAIVFLLAPETYLAILFTPEYARAALAFSVLVVGYLLNSLPGPEGKVLEGLGYSRLTLLNTLVLLTVNGVLDVLLVPQYGIVGAAFGTAIALGVAAFVGLLEIYYFTGIQPYSQNLVRVLFCGLVSIPIARIVTITFESRHFVAILLPITVVVVYLLALNALDAFTDEDKAVATSFDDRVGIEIFEPLISLRRLIP